jgi:hypothetical protein
MYTLHVHSDTELQSVYLPRRERREREKERERKRERERELQSVYLPRSLLRALLYQPTSSTSVSA